MCRCLALRRPFRVVFVSFIEIILPFWARIVYPTELANFFPFSEVSERVPLHVTVDLQLMGNLTTPLFETDSLSFPIESLDRTVGLGFGFETERVVKLTSVADPNPPALKQM